MMSRFCEQCGSVLVADARFCEQCGNPVPEVYRSGDAERTIGHVPVRLEKADRGQLGRVRPGDYELVITSTQLLLVRGGPFEDEAWLGEQSDLEQLAETTGAPWREVADTYDLGKELWQPLYTTPAEEMLAWHKTNEAILLDDILAASVTLDPDGSIDRLDLHLAGGSAPRFTIYLALGRPAAKFLTEALGAGRTQTTGRT